MDLLFDMLKPGSSKEKPGFTLPFIIWWFAYPFFAKKSFMKSARALQPS